MRVCSFLVFVLAVVVGAPLSAQSCLGLPNGSPVNARVAITPDDGATQWSGRVGAFVKQAFVGVSGDYTRISYFDGSARNAGVDLGYQIALNAKKTVHLCPMLGATYLALTLRLRSTFGEDPFFNDLQDEVRSDGRNLMAGVGIGGTNPISPTVDLVPFANLGLLRSREDTSVPFFGFDPFGEAPMGNVWRTFGVLGFGVGLQFSHRYMITVATTRTISSAGNSSQMKVGGAMGFGKR